MSYIVSLTAESSGISTALPMACRVRAYAYMPSASSLFCSTPIPNAWIPVLDGVTVPALPAPTTNPSPRPPNAVTVPADFNPADLCFLFQDLLPTGTSGTYPSVVTPDVVIPPYEEKIPIVGLIRLYMEADPIPYDRTPTSEVMTCTLSINQVASPVTDTEVSMPCILSINMISVPVDGGGSSDPDFADVIVLMPLSADFDDYSSNAFTVTTYGTPTINSGVTLFGQNTTLLEGADEEAFNIDIGTAGAFGTGDFTIEAHRLFDSSSALDLIAAWGDSGGTWRWAFYHESGSLILALDGGATTYSRSWSLSTGTFYHVAASRVSGVLRLFVDGTQLGSNITMTDNITTLSGALLGVFTLPVVLVPPFGRGANFRLTSVGRYSASFTAPTAQYPTS
jgi:hypothetical protein